MITPSLPPETSPEDTATLNAILRIIADPQAAQKQLDALHSKWKELKDYHAKVQADSESLAANRTQLAQDQAAAAESQEKHKTLVKLERDLNQRAVGLNELRDQLEARRKQLEADKLAMEARFDTRRDEAQKDQAEVREKIQQLNDKLAEADKVKADYEGRIANLKRLVA